VPGPRWSPAGPCSSSRARAPSGRGWRWSCSEDGRPVPGEAARLRRGARPAHRLGLLSRCCGAEGRRAHLDRVDVVQPALFRGDGLARPPVEAARDPAQRGGRPLAGRDRRRARGGGVVPGRRGPRGWRCASRPWPPLAGARPWPRCRPPPSGFRTLIEPWGDVLHVARSTARVPVGRGHGGPRSASSWRWASGDGVRIRRIQVDLRLALPQVEPIQRGAGRAVGADRAAHRATAFYSAVTGGPGRGRRTGRGVRYTEPARDGPLRRRWARCWSTANGSSSECSPHPVLLYGLQETFEERGYAAGRGRAVAVESLRRARAGPERSCSPSARRTRTASRWTGPRCFADSALTGRAGAHPLQVQLPTYPFQRRRYWLEQPEVRATRRPRARRLRHGLVSACSTAWRRTSTYSTGRISTRLAPWLRDHAVAGTVLLPGTASSTGGARVRLSGQSGVQELSLEAPLVLRDEESVRLPGHRRVRQRSSNVAAAARCTGASAAGAASGWHETAPAETVTGAVPTPRHAAPAAPRGSLLHAALPGQPGRVHRQFDEGGARQQHRSGDAWSPATGASASRSSR